MSVLTSLAFAQGDFYAAGCGAEFRKTKRTKTLARVFGKRFMVLTAFYVSRQNVYFCRSAILMDRELSRFL